MRALGPRSWLPRDRARGQGCFQPPDRAECGCVRTILLEVLGNGTISSQGVFQAQRSDRGFGGLPPTAYQNSYCQLNIVLTSVASMHHTVAGKQSKHALETNGYLECSQLFRKRFDFNETGPILCLEHGTMRVSNQYCD